MASRDADRLTTALLDRVAVRAVLLVVAYLLAATSILSYALLNAGRGPPTKLQLLLLIITLGIIWFLSFKTAWS